MELNFVQGKRLGPSLVLLCTDINVPIYEHAVFFLQCIIKTQEAQVVCTSVSLGPLFHSIDLHACLCASPAMILEL